MNDLAAAEQKALQTIDREPGLLPAHLALVSVLLLKRDHVRTGEHLLKMRDRFRLLV